jgi:DNA modification methylase
MVADLIEDCSKRGQVILDSFSGSGTTLIAAERSGRHGYAIELDPGYVDVAVERYQRVFGIDAVHTETGETFAATRQRRSAIDTV